MMIVFAFGMLPALRRAPWPHFAVNSQWPPQGVDEAAVWTEGVDAGPLGRSVDSWAEARFRGRLIAEAGEGSYRPDYEGIIDAANTLAAGMRPSETTAAARRVLQSCFPDWPPSPPGSVGLLYWFKRLFAKPLPVLSTKLCSIATFAFGHWLMGSLELADLDEGEPGVGDGKGQLIVVRRCRFLEQSACASICVNSCKMPTQDFFSDDMGIPLRIEPDYETLRCEFKFGVAPSTEDEAAARAVPCFSACPHGGRLRDQGADRCSAMDD